MIRIHYPYADPLEVSPGIEFGNMPTADILTGTSLKYGMDFRGKGLLLLEPPLVERFAYTKDLWAQARFVLTFVEMLPDGRPLPSNAVGYRYAVPPLWPELGPLCRRPWAERRNAMVAVMGNKYGRRVHMLDYVHERCLDHGIEFEVYGRPGFYDRPYYRGPIEDKRALLEQYRWCYCPENSFHANYLSEKLPEAVLAGCVPVIDMPECYAEVYYGTFPWFYVQGINSFHNVTADTHRLFLSEVHEETIRREMRTEAIWNAVRKAWDEFHHV
jgi:hypothetical protein